MSINLYVHLYFCPFTCLSFICLFIYLSVHLSVYPVVCLSIYLSVHLYVCLFIYLSIYLSVHLCLSPLISTSFCPSVLPLTVYYQSMCLFICVSVNPFICPSVCLSICLWGMLYYTYASVLYVVHGVKFPISLLIFKLVVNSESATFAKLLWSFIVIKIWCYIITSTCHFLEPQDGF
jgi:hypothetical protein